MASPEEPPKAEPTEQDREVARMLLEQQESDRGCVIFCAAMLEDELESLLRANCLKAASVVKKVVDPMFQGYAPLSTFSAKIQVSYALGLIPEHVYEGLNLIRKLRNVFAHEKASVSFRSAKHRDLLMEIFGSWRRDPDDDEKIPHMGKTTKGQFVQRMAFCIYVSGLVARIQVAKEITSGGPTKSPLLLKERLEQIVRPGKETRGREET